MTEMVNRLPGNDDKHEIKNAVFALSDDDAIQVYLVIAHEVRDAFLDLLGIQEARIAQIRKKLET